MADQDIKKMSQKVNCEVCDKVLCKSFIKKHMETQHNKKAEMSTIIEESTKRAEEHVNMEEESTKKTNESDKTEEESNKKPEPTQEPVIVHNLINLNTAELDSLLEQEEDFLDAVETLENDIGLDVNLSVNESLVLFMQDDKNYRSNFARTMELEQVDQSRKEKFKLEIELENYIKNNNISETAKSEEKKSNIKSLKEENVTLNNKFRTSTKIVKKLEHDLKSSQDLLAKTSSENVQVKQKISTKECLEVARKENKEEDIVVIDDTTTERNMLECDKCDFVSKSKEAKMGHEMSSWTVMFVENIVTHTQS